MSGSSPKDPTSDKPYLKLVGVNGNAFLVPGLAGKTARKAGWPKSRINAVLEEAQDGDYEHLLTVVCRHFDVH